MTTFLSFVVSFVAVFLTMPIFRQLAVRLKIVDLPSRRKIHKRATPLLGGAAIYFGLLCGVLFDHRFFKPILPLLLGSIIIVALGVIDDTKGLRASFRFFCEVIVALIVVSFGQRITFLPFKFWGDFAEVIITIIWIVGVINAYNYLDGLDGLAAGSAIINLLCFSIILFKTGQYYLSLFAAILIGACLGFLPYNFKKAKVFLGDAGSTLLGFSLAYIALAGDWASDNIVKISIPVLILGVPIFDMIFTTIMRIKEGKVKTLLEWLKYGAKDHFHHYLVDLGFTTTGAVIFIYFVTLSLGISAILLSNDPAIEALLSLLQASIIFGIIATLIVIGKLHRSES